jgi:hypothetical protein
MRRARSMDGATGVVALACGLILCACAGMGTEDGNPAAAEPTVVARESTTATTAAAPRELPAVETTETSSTAETVRTTPGSDTVSERPPIPGDIVPLSIDPPPPPPPRESVDDESVAGPDPMPWLPPDCDWTQPGTHCPRPFEAAMGRAR